LPFSGQEVSCSAIGRRLRRTRTLNNLDQEVAMSLSRSWAAAAVAAAALLNTPGAWADPALYSIGSDANGVGRMLNEVTSSTTGVGLGDGTVAFNGGLAYSATESQFYAIENDSFGQSYLTSFGLGMPGALSTPVSLGAGFLGGLALDTTSASLYAIGSDFLGNSTLYSVGSSGATAVDAIGVGFFGGLTYDKADNSFYAIGADDSFVQRRVSRIDLSGGSATVTTLFDLGDAGTAFNGGLAYDAATSSFSVIGNDSFGNSALYSFTSAGAASLTSLQSIGVGFLNAGLVIAPAGAFIATPVPEPSTAALCIAGLIALAMWRSARRACT
jgi:hypothetical protein